MTNEQRTEYEYARNAWRQAELDWDQEIRKTHGKPWYKLDFAEDAIGEPGSTINACYHAFQAAMAQWVSVNNPPLSVLRESRNVA